MKRSLVFVLLVCAGCSQDVRLGAVGADSGSVTDTADAAIEATGNRMLVLVAPLGAQCEGSLQGRETEFAGWDASTAGFVEGPLQLTWVTETSLQISGAPIQEAFQVPSIGLLPHVVPEQPEALLIGIVSMAGTAPTGMSKEAGLLSVDRTSITSQSIDGQAGILYTDAGTEGTCQLSIDIVIELQF